MLLSLPLSCLCKVSFHLIQLLALARRLSNFQQMAYHALDLVIKSQMFESQNFLRLSRVRLYQGGRLGPIIREYPITHGIRERLRHNLQRILPAHALVRMRRHNKNLIPRHLRIQRAHMRPRRIIQMHRRARQRRLRLAPQHHRRRAPIRSRHGRSHRRRELVATQDERGRDMHDVEADARSMLRHPRLGRVQRGHLGRHVGLEVGRDGEGPVRRRRAARRGPDAGAAGDGAEAELGRDGGGDDDALHARRRRRRRRRLGRRLEDAERALDRGRDVHVFVVFGSRRAAGGDGRGEMDDAFDVPDRVVVGAWHGQVGDGDEGEVGPGVQALDGGRVEDLLRLRFVSYGGPDSVAGFEGEDESAKADVAGCAGD